MSRRTNGNGDGKALLPQATAIGREPIVLEEAAFLHAIALERKRSERSRKLFLLMLLDAGDALPAEKRRNLLGEVLTALGKMSRETDVTGWYKADRTVGAMFTDLIEGAQKSIVSTILARVSSALHEGVHIEAVDQINISMHLFPEEWHSDGPHFPSNPVLYPDLKDRQNANKMFTRMKRLADIVGSLLVLLLLSPLFAMIAFLVKISSKGPVIFKQQRLGQYGKTFNFLKFRTMFVNNDASAHKEYVRQLIAGQAAKQPTNGDGKGNNDGVFKLTNDSRITRVGAFLRRASLDELPQLFNVLRGEMSLVGPRPPLPYEVENYAAWHRRRLVEAKPGITGLWQVNGRSRVGFDEMVRLDLRYARNCSTWLDLQIMLNTPRAVIGGDGAY